MYVLRYTIACQLLTMPFSTWSRSWLHPVVGSGYCAVILRRTTVDCYPRGITYCAELPSGFRAWPWAYL